MLCTGFLNAGMKASLLRLPASAVGRVKLTVSAARLATVVHGNNRLMARTPKRLMTRLVTNSCMSKASILVTAVSRPKKRVRLSSDSKVWV